MKKWIASFALWVTGWKVELEGDVNNLDRCVLVVAPHTSNWEFVLGAIVRKLGGIGINRSQRNNLVQFVTDLYQKQSFSLVVTPEGTRSRVNKWRMGFYHIALSAQVPIVLGAGDFKEKKIYIGKSISITDLQNRPLESIMTEIQEYYTHITPKYPDQWNPQIF